jgi:tetratricopeptide (TPR) repeat protein
MFIKSQTEMPDKAGDQKSYWAFISYSSKDRKWGEWLHRRLENYPIPSEFRGLEVFDGAVLGKNLRPVFRDRDELAGSSNLGEAIHTALEASRFLVVLCSKNAGKSKWVNKEIEDFQAMGKGGRILALILDGEPNATAQGLTDEECFPPALRYPAEPIAGDLRKEGDGKERGFLKVLAGIAQLDFDKLYRRHERVQARKRLTVILFAFLLSTVFAGLALFAWQQRSVAIQHRISAERARYRAESAARETENLIVFIIFDLRDKLKPLGKLDLLEGIYEKAEGYFQNHHDRRNILDSERIRAADLMNRADLFKAKGDLKAALAAANEAVEIFEKLIALNPDITLWKHDLCVSLIKIGDLLSMTGDVSRAAKRYRRSAEIAEKEIMPNETVSPSWWETLFSAKKSLGHLAADSGDLSDAEGLYRQALSIAEKLSAFDPNNVSWQRELSVSHGTLGELLKGTRNLKEAKKHIIVSLAIIEKLVVRAPDNTDWLRDLMANYNQTGKILMLTDNVSGAGKHFRLALEIAERLTKLDASQTLWQSDLSDCHLNLGNLLTASNEFDEAEKHAHKALETTERLINHDARNQEWQRDLFFIYAQLGMISTLRKSWDAAQEWLQKGLAIADQIIARYKNDDYYSIRENALNLLNNCQVQQADLEAALSTQERLATHFREKNDAAGVVSSLIVKVMFQNKLGKDDDAAATWFRIKEFGLAMEDLPKILLVFELTGDMKTPVEACLKRIEDAPLSGIGIKVEKAEGGLMIQEVIQKGAAFDDGRLKQGDVITAVAQADGVFKELAHLSVQDGCALLKGKNGTRVRLRVREMPSGELSSEREMTLGRKPLPQ